MKRVNLLASTLALTVAPSMATAAPVIFAGNGHSYQVVSGPQDWIAAEAAAEVLGGYLATITSAEENAFVASLLPTSGTNIRGWLGGSDAQTEGTWQWVVGPEAGQTFYIKGGSSQPGYSNWSAIGGEPNSGGGDEDYAEMFGSADLESGRSTWNDLAEAGTPDILSIVEFNAPAAAVPEPASWAMMIVGVGLIGAGLRDRQRRAVLRYV
ncbi:PEPxxWA-CTERM sorting domain-containing protein [Sphingomonas bacterium]|uniref:PEPxxWA-CTERM sorting domain-containing protein n=1 Tax=Sphingomonas bacterium TaxID=1895847 RepID=UPI0020C6FBA9|nr:PEPxxWA-CTERM sorting domain-containing protein [Sphingomonas bacterium]